MHIAVVRRSFRASFSMDVYADGLLQGLRQARPDWVITEFTPSFQEYQGSTWNRGMNYYRRYWAFPRHVRRQVKTAGIDLVHVIDHSDGHLAYRLRGLSCPVVMTCHDLINYRQPENIQAQAKIAAVSMALWKYAVGGIREADHILTVSDHTAKDVMEIFGLPPGQLTTAYNGVHPAFRPLSPAQVRASRRRYSLAPETWCLLNVGSNHPRKNVFAIVRALQQLRRQGWPVHLLKAGADFTPPQWDYLRSEQLTDCVTYVGKPEQAELVALYNAADVLVAPSFWEGFGITPLEAMACGTPVVAANGSSLPEVVGPAGLLVDPTDVPAIAAAIQRVCQSPDLQHQLFDAGRQRAQQFTWERHGEQAARVYEQLLQP